MFDDLTAENYEMVYDPLDFDRMEMIVEKIAKYHALSLVLIDQGDTHVKDYKLIFTEEMRHMFVPMLRIMQQLVDHVKTWPGYERLGANTEKMIETFPDLMVNSMRRDFSAFYSILNHGDFHIRNLMFKRTAEGELSDVLFLDFQMPNFGVPCFDFFNMMTSMCDEEVRRREPEIVKMYHRHLVASLKTYGFTGEVPTLIDIQIALLRMAEYRVFYSFVLGPMFRLRGFELGAMFTMEGNAEVTKALEVIFKDPVFIDDMKLALDNYDANGILDG